MSGRVTASPDGRHVYAVSSNEPAVAAFAKNDCQPAATVLCLRDGRFQVEIEWRDFMDRVGPGQVVPVMSNDSGLFWFFAADNWELLVKILDGCSFNDHYWVFSAATTNVEYTLRVIDTTTQEVREYVNPLGSAAAAITDTAAFATCP